MIRKRREIEAPVTMWSGLSPVVGALAEGSAPGRLIVEVPGEGRPRQARTTVSLDPPTIRRAIDARQAVLLLFEEGDRARPIVVGLLQSEAAAPGRTRVIEAEDELVLKCGHATLTMRRNGKVVLRGAYVETRADGTNRIKGGTVKIN
jgi:hypothetical protein